MNQRQKMKEIRRKPKPVRRERHRRHRRAIVSGRSLEVCNTLCSLILCIDVSSSGKPGAAHVEVEYEYEQEPQRQTLKNTAW